LAEASEAVTVEASEAEEDLEEEVQNVELT
jgi:hypothetical protein